MLPRHTDLARRTPLVRRAPAPTRQPNPRARTGRGKATPAAPVGAALRQLIYRRDQHRCVRCGHTTIGAAHSLQHRQARGMGGRVDPHTPANLILLCGTGITGCHGWVEDRTNWAAATSLGWVVSSFHPDPATVPVLVQWLGWCLPGTTWTPTEPGPGDTTRPG